MSVSAMYNPEIPPPTTTTSQDNGLKDDFSSSGKKIEKVKFEGICDWIQKCFKRSVFFSEGTRKESWWRGGELNKVILSGGICPEFQTLSL